MLRILLLALLLFSLPINLSANNGELTICTQNLNNFGLLREVKKRVPYIQPKDLGRKKKALIDRIAVVGCDIVAVQEVLSVGEREAAMVLSQFARELSFKTRRLFRSTVGPSNDKRLFLGFLYSSEKISLAKTESFRGEVLPRISDYGPNTRFSRGPFMAEFRRREEERAEERLRIVNFHFKSKSTKGGYDRTGYSFETKRIMMAEGLRQIAMKLDREEDDENTITTVVLGDRNSEPFSASGEILTGKLKISQFRSQEKESCKLSKSTRPLCTFSYSGSAPKLRSVFEDKRMPIGSYRYRGKDELIDDILLPAEDLNKVARIDGVSYSGISFDHKDASDHGMPWVVVRLP